MPEESLLSLFFLIKVDSGIIVDNEIDFEKMTFLFSNGTIIRKLFFFPLSLIKKHAHSTYFLLLCTISFRKDGL